MSLEAVAESSATTVLSRLSNVSHGHGGVPLAALLTDLSTWLADDLRTVRASLERLTAAGTPTPVTQAAGHLLGIDGKRLRPLCVMLASRLADAPSAGATGLAIAVELVHNATLLHDDVVDIAPTRRGLPAARMVYGNAASIFAGDWLLIEALRRIDSTGQPGLLREMLDVIGEMIEAEAVQLECRGQAASMDRATYARIAHGKTGALFGWALGAGATIGGASRGAVSAMTGFGHELGVTFQIVDDCLDFAADAARTGKLPMADLREGKLTYPLLVALERAPDRRADLAAMLGRADGDPDWTPRDADLAWVRTLLHDTNAVAVARADAARRIDAAVHSLGPVPEGRAKQALVDVARATIERQA